ncbi:hypothetical protein [Bradyrhizobium sp. S3.2.12]|uniref:hypothetical protein n=1 Tax=Bradyrhizobium sp. S3.2.12 TaxID=3156387 RepID=UPI003395CBC1
MMNGPGDLAHKVVDQMKATPFVLAILIVNITVLAGFAYTCTRSAPPSRAAIPSSNAASSRRTPWAS